VTSAAGTGPDHAAGVVDRDEVMHALAALTRPQRAVVVLRYYEDYDDAAIAAALGCPQTTVRSHAHRGLARLRSALQPTSAGAVELARTPAVEEPS
jgi:RNA polymerase sigma factor (sigma-70 family)